MRSIRDLTYLEAVRPVSNADSFLDKASLLASIIFENDEPTGIIEITDRDIVGEDEPMMVGTSAPLCRIFNADGLRLPLIERYSVPGTRSENAFSSAARILREGKEIPKKQRDKRHRDNKEYVIGPLKASLNRIQIEHGHPDPDNLRVQINHIGFRFIGEIANGGVELTLIPNIADETTAVLVEQSKESAEVLSKISKGVSYPASPQSLQIPFATLDLRTPPDQTERFINKLHALFPLYVRAHEPRITNQISV